MRYERQNPLNPNLSRDVSNQSNNPVVFLKYPKHGVTRKMTTISLENSTLHQSSVESKPQMKLSSYNLNFQVNGGFGSFASSKEASAVRNEMQSSL